ncbi:MAG: ferritin-like domain-containing protein [Ectothiorhodospiraceae bacterium]|nr:ferritin-like domain-containing protein [Chromatiales bacterium]MCP5157249.1 ferritin-like domain-containing protein [Ectothiorhodospiraceae bacterium]
MEAELRALACEALGVDAPGAKVAAVGAIGATVDAGRFTIDPAAAIDAPEVAGRPQRPELVDPRDLPRRRISSGPGRIALFHAVAHIEFNAINLALDAVARFAGMPDAYYLDWLQVAREEARHFELVRELLADRGAAYGDLPAHDGLWETARRTADDVLARMALVPRLLEARGLDVTPGIQARLRTAGDEAGVAVLDVILRDEIGHVAIGNRWYRRLCAERSVDPIATFDWLRARYDAPGLNPPFNLEARARAGFTPEELSRLVARGPDAARRNSG